MRQKLAGAVLALGLAVLPQAAQAESSLITRADGSTAAPVNNVFNLYADQVNGDIATNRFQDFTLANGQLANMYFRVNANGQDAAALFNFVENDINIAGTVNAIRDNKIGGELFFLTPKNIVVSGTGVINAGAITLMSGGAYPGSDDGALDYAKNYRTGEYLADDNYNGSVTVAGRLNATDYISLVSSKSIVLKTESGAGAQLTTKENFNFGDLVNIKKADGSVGADSKLDTGSLKLQRSAGSKGNIMVLAHAEKTNEKDDAIQGWMDVAGDNTVKAEVSMEQGTVISSDGGEVSIAATAIRNNSSFGNLATFGDIGGASAAVTINGSVTGDNIDVDAHAENVYTKGVWEQLTGIVKGGVKKFLNDRVGDVGDLDIAFLGQRTTSSVDIGKTAELTALGTDGKDEDGNALEVLRISATTSSKMRSNVNASTNGSAGGWNVAGVGFLYGYLENEATIKVEDGAKLFARSDSNDVKATSGMKLEAKADTDMMLTAGAKAKVDEKAPETDKVAGALVIGLGHTNADITVEQGATLAAQNDLTLAAATTHSSTNEAKVISRDSTYVSTAVQVTDMDSTAAIAANGLLKAEKGKLALDAANKADVDAYANNAVDHILSDPSFIDKIANFLPDYANKMMGTAVKSLEKKFFGEVAAKQPDLSNKSFSLGASINVTAGTHTAEVNVGEQATLTAGGDMELTAVQNMDDVNLTALGKSSGNNKSAVISASFLYGGLDSRAAVNVKGSKDGGAKLTAGGDMKLDAQTIYKWNRPEAMWNFFLDRWTIFSSTFAELFTDDLKAVDGAVKDYQKNPTAENYNKIAKAASKDGVVVALTDLVKIVAKSPADLLNMIRALEAFLDGSGYTNINVGSVARTGSEYETEPKADVAVAVSVEDFQSRAAVVVGDKAELKADGKLAATAEASQLDVNYYGQLKGIAETFDENNKLNDTLKKILAATELDVKVIPAWNSGKNAAGGTIGWSTNSVESGVIVAEGAVLEGASVDLKANTDITRVLVTLGGSVAGSTGFTGMFSGVEGQTNSFVVVDDEASLHAKNKDGVTLQADNNALIVNALGDLTISGDGSGGATALGAAVGYVKNDVNTIAAVADNDRDASREKGSEVEKLNTLLTDFLTDEQKALLGLKETTETGKIETTALQVNAESSPVIVGVAAAGAVAKKAPSDDDESIGPGDLLEEPNDLDSGSEGGGNQDVLDDVGANNAHVSGKTITGAGAVSIQGLSGSTAALLENTQVTLTGGERKVSLCAYENGVAVGVDGALALKLNTGSTTSVSVAGTSAVNDISTTVVSQLKGSTIKDAADISNYAHQDETLVALAVPVSIDASEEETKGFSGALNISVNKVQNNVHANLTDNTVTNTVDKSVTNVQNVAYDTSAQITGGVNVDVAKSTMGLGINAAWAQLENNVSAAVTGGSYTGVGAFHNEAVTDLTQVSVGVGVGVGKGDSSVATAGAVWSHGKVTNNVNATLQDTTISGQTLTNRAYDGEVKSNGLHGAANGSTDWRGLVKELGADVDGTDTEQLLSKEQLKTDVKTDVLDDNVDFAQHISLKDDLPSGGSTDVYSSGSLSFDTNKGNKIYTGALEVAASTGPSSKATLGVAVADSVVDNDYTASVSGAKTKITLSGADGLAVLAKTDSYLADFAVGVSVAKGSDASILQGAGSAAVSLLDNDTVAKITGSAINAAKTTVQAATNSDMVGVAGDVGYANSKVGIGLGVVVNRLDNETKALLNSSTLKGVDSVSGGSTAVALNAENTGSLMALAIGLSAVGSEGETFLAAQGNVAVNSGKMDTVAAMDKEKDGSKNTVDKAAAIEIKAKDSSEQTAAAAALGISMSKGSAGLGFAVNEIRGQQLAARLNNTDITAADSGADIDVTTDETMSLTTVAAGIGISNNDVGTLQGYVAINKTADKQNTAEISRTTLKDDKQQSDVAVKAAADNKIVSNADAIAVGFDKESLASAGIAVSTIDLGSDVSARVDGATLSAKDVLVNATADDRMYNVAVGVGVSDSTVDVAGSVSSNKLDNNVNATVNNSTVKALNSVGVLADSKDKLVNVTGGFSIGITSNVGVGLSVAVNEISGDTVAKVTGSVIEAQGQGDKTFTAHQYTTDADNKMTTAATDHKGLVVDAYSNHDTTDVVLTVGVDVAGAGLSLSLAGSGSSENLGARRRRWSAIRRLTRTIRRKRAMSPSRRWRRRTSTMWMSMSAWAQARAWPSPAAPPSRWPLWTVRSMRS